MNVPTVEAEYSPKDSPQLHAVFPGARESCPPVTTPHNRLDLASLMGFF